jgi:hypothetical protein
MSERPWRRADHPVLYRGGHLGERIDATSDRRIWCGCVLGECETALCRLVRGRVAGSAELGWCDAEAGCGRAGVQGFVPDGDDQVRIADGQGAG